MTFAVLAHILTWRAICTSYPFNFLNSKQNFCGKNKLIFAFSVFNIAVMYIIRFKL
ncbi:hypothetical protein GBFDFA_06875 [Edwardsiella anguillarum]|uniref:Uncharacterized protein n=1 Tax=Edwardsiella anguillarum ET080813 TaxID=667120 RepID=A0A076LMJ2_9GAMM|nr:Hypothetical protein ETEE_3306 [Edwardsiella anguillarum ET080813]BET80558.1 hypothetical protein PBOPBF_06875 [Edwardsiella anguillarum]BET83847.1 hypothetical protein GHNJMD_07185 [Edwardsiella anguillarum]BET87214.1 hypothetical protein GBFDFA_06875 [Edwardsiella anguillarum]BET90640.1 hypothetical protein BIKEJJ_06880 [Edwardsiella anguillarum]